ncbi:MULTISPECIES: efflux RND transporter periplasmic adaptor subunit [unclassified Leptolyngbya]|uniref:efflux RND transporter periplasmic adaptor subunit n=1 Tax=unclassified Leptolyngbya TaxID=2650499 RepID=UPI001685E4A0|nr:efflux RND transporter periplasmic adaptor subunit [Leptolyngbya sp. FACHB-8]MBD2158423.1 efflux RND transporter periplasmic adaptor subunit [Leptolyngbya sp. FACHB-16]
MKRYSLLGITLLLSSLTAACGKIEAPAKASSPPPASVQLQTLQSSTLQDSTDFVGTLEAEQTVQLKPQIDGRIDRILVKPGDRVQQGDPIFLLNLDQTASEVNSAQANVNAAVAARNTLVQQLRVAQSQLTSAQSEYELAQVNNHRYQYLVTQGAVDQATGDQYATALKVKSDTVKQAQEQVKAARAAVEQADANIHKAEADAATARVSLSFKQVIAPISGAVGDITLKPGDYVTTGQVLTTINQNEAFDLQLPIPINRSDELRTGLSVQLLEPNTEQPLSSGRIYFVASKADPTAQSILARARFSNARGYLRDAQYVKARVIWNTKPGVLVPTTAVTTIGGQNFVFTAEDKIVNGKTQTIAHQIPVTLGAIQGQNYQVVKGLKPGDRVIVSGILKLQEGTPVAPQVSNTARSAL